MNKLPIEDLVSVVELWQMARKPLAEKFSQGGLRAFVETHNAKTRQMISLLGKQDPEFYSALLELTQNASTMVAGGKIIADKIDRTNL